MGTYTRAPHSESGETSCHDRLATCTARSRAHTRKGASFHARRLKTWGLTCPWGAASCPRTACPSLLLRALAPGHPAPPAAPTAWPPSSASALCGPWALRADGCTELPPSIPHHPLVKLRSNTTDTFVCPSRHLGTSRLPRLNHILTGHRP